MNNTIDYYNLNAQAFIENTRDVDMHLTQEKFLYKLHGQAAILDFGCGSGRDTKFFMEKGYHVTAVDGSEELCRLASRFTGIEVRQMLFQELNEKQVYDGIWACSSILHLPGNELLSVLRKMCVALKDAGVIYTSFKYGDFEGERNGRYFIDFTEEKFLDFVKEIPEIRVVEAWITSDVRPGRGEEKWLNLIMQKI